MEKSIAVTQTAAEPPNQGRIIFEMRGCTRKSRQALVKIVQPKSSGTAEASLAAADLKATNGRMIEVDTADLRLGTVAECRQYC